MREWIAAHGLTTCGFDGCRIEEGEPVQLIRLAGLKPKFRCQRHAHGPVDWDQVNASKTSPAPTSRQPEGFTRMSRIRTEFDPKLKAAGDD